MRHKSKPEKVISSEIQKYVLAYVKEFQNEIPCTNPAEWDTNQGKAAMRRATKAIMKSVAEHYGVIVLSKKDAKAFLHAIENPKPPTPALRALMRGDFDEVDRIYQLKKKVALEQEVKKMNIPDFKNGKELRIEHAINESIDSNVKSAVIPNMTLDPVKDAHILEELANKGYRVQSMPYQSTHTRGYNLVIEWY